MLIAHPSFALDCVGHTAEGTKSREPKSLQSEIEAQRAPRLDSTAVSLFGWSEQIQCESSPRWQDPNNYSDTETRALFNQEFYFTIYILPEVLELFIKLAFQPKSVFKTVFQGTLSKVSCQVQKVTLFTKIFKDQSIRGKLFFVFLVNTFCFQTYMYPTATKCHSCPFDCWCHIWVQKVWRTKLSQNGQNLNLWSIKFLSGRPNHNSPL